MPIRRIVYAAGKLLVTTSQDFTGRIQDAESGRQPAVSPHDGAVVVSVVLRDERLLATSAGGSVRVWESRSL